MADGAKVTLYVWPEGIVTSYGVGPLIPEISIKLATAQISVAVALPPDCDIMSADCSSDRITSVVPQSMRTCLPASPQAESAVRHPMPTKKVCLTFVPPKCLII